MKALSSRNPFRLGLLALAAAAALGLAVVLLSVVPFGKHTYTAVLAQSAGLRPKEDVLVHGVRVGEVRSVELAGNSVRVRFTVDDGVALGDQTTAAVKVATLLGTHSLAVVPRGPGRLTDDTIPLSRTTVPFNLQDVLNQGTHRLEQLDSAKLARLLSVMADQLAPSTAEIGPALTGVVRLSNVVTRRSGQIGDLLTAADRVTNQLSASTGDLVALMKQANLVVAEVTARRAAIHDLLREATRLSRSVDAIIGQTRADVQPALHALDGALTELNRQDGTLRQVLRTMAPSVRYLANASGNAPYVDLYAHPPLLPPDDASCRLSGSCR